MKVYLIYQDCATCKFGLTAEEIIEKGKSMGMEVMLRSYVMPGAKELILAAHKKGVEVPFFTDGKKFGDTLMDLLPKSKTKPAKKAKKEVKNGASTEAA